MRLALTLVLCAVSLPCAADGVLAEYMRRAEGFGFAGSVLVAKDGAVVLEGSYGLADAARGTRVGPHMPFYVASISKPFTAAAILKLEMEGKLSVRDSIDRHLPNVPEGMRGITIHHLLTHTSGLDDVDMPFGTTRDAFVAAVLARPALAAPGAKYRYSNAGYALLAAIVERVSGEPFAAYLRSRIFAPAGMNDTRIMHETSGPATVRVRRGGLDQGDAYMSHRRPYAFDEQGPTGLVTTAGDLYRWHLALQETKILSAELKRQYETEHVKGYGYGWAFAATSRGTRLITHAGLRFPEGWNGELRRYVDEDVVIIVLSNVFQGGQALSEPVTRDLARLGFGGEVAFPPPVGGSGAKVSGEYALPTGGRFVIRDNVLEAIGQDAVNALEGLPADKFTADNDRTRALIAAVRTNTVGDVANENQKRVLIETWKGLVGKFGPYVSHDVLHSARMPGDDEAVTTFARLCFERGSTVGRYIWREGKLLGTFDLGSFEGPMQQVEVFPAPMPLVPQGAGMFATWNFAGRSSVFRIAGDPLTVRSGEISATASRRDPAPRR